MKSQNMIDNQNKRDFSAEKFKALKKAGLIVLILLSVLEVTPSSEAESLSECSVVQRYALTGSSAYQKGHYNEARDYFIKQAGWSETCYEQEALRAMIYNNIALTFIQQHEYLKAKAWLLLTPKNKQSIYHMKLIQPKLEVLDQPSGPAGEYWQYAGKGTWNKFFVTPSGKYFRIMFQGIFAGENAMSGNTHVSIFEDTLPIRDGKAVYHQEIDACDVTMQFTGTAVHFNTEGDCGLGYGIQAKGDFIRVKH